MVERDGDVLQTREIEIFKMIWAAGPRGLPWHGELCPFKTRDDREVVLRFKRQSAIVIRSGRVSITRHKGCDPGFTKGPRPGRPIGGVRLDVTVPPEAGDKFELGTSRSIPKIAERLAQIVRTRGSSR